jgi:hypothetical protein
MSDPANPTLGDLITDGARIRVEAKEAILGLADVADRLAAITGSASPQADRLRRAEHELATDDFKLIVMGRFSSGKSTLLNALMAGVTHPVDLQGVAGPLPVDDLPTTAILAGITYADKPYVTAWGFDGSADRWTFDRYLRESMLDGTRTREENLERFRDIRQFEIGYPARLCRDGVTLYDSPGTDEAPERTYISQEASRTCDAAIVVFSSQAVMGLREVEDAVAAADDGVETFVVVNMFHGKVADERFRGVVWNKYVHEHQGGPPYSGQDLAERGIYLVDALAAQEGRLRGDAALVERSGLAALERRLADFLVNERQGVHVKRFAEQAVNLSRDVDRHIEGLRSVLQVEQDKLRAAYQQVLPRMHDLRRRSARVGEIIEDNKVRARAKLQLSLMESERAMRDGLAEHLAATPLESASGLTATFRIPKIQNEADEVVNAYINAHRGTWSTTTATRQLNRISESLLDELGAEVADVAREIDEINFQLTGKEVSREGRTAVISATERITSAMAGIVLGDLSAGVTGGAGGWRGAAGGVAAALGVAVIAVGAGVAAPVAIPAMLIASLIAGAATGKIGLERRIKEKVGEHAVEMLRGQQDQLLQTLFQDIDRAFKPLAEAATAEITAVLDAEEQSIHDQAALNQSDLAARQRAQATLDEATAAVATHRKALENAATISRQILA